jgi:hypothetical protein
LTTENLLQKDRKMENENANTQNSTFANRTSQRTAKVCKRAVFLLNASLNY